MRWCVGCFIIIRVIHQIRKIEFLFKIAQTNDNGKTNKFTPKMHYFTRKLNLRHVAKYFEADLRQVSFNFRIKSVNYPKLNRFIQNAKQLKLYGKLICLEY